MSRRETAARHLPDVSVTRRQALRGAVGGGLTLGAAKAVDNVLVGYGTAVGTNLVEQAASGALGSLAGAGFGPKRGVRFGLGGDSLTLRDGAVTVRSGQDAVTRRPLSELDSDWAGSVGLAAPLAGLAADLGAIARDEHTVTFHRLDAFVERVRDAEARPLTVNAVRRWPAADPDRVAEFTDADPADPPALIRGMVGGFREHTYYDAPRYLAGSIQDNVLFGAVDLRAPFRDPVGFPALLDDGKTGLFCYEFTHRSLEALHAVSAVEQALPVVAARVWDKRHKHVYTAVGSVVREDGDLVVPMTFVDYTHTTLYHDARLTGLLGEGLEAYNERHRASVVHWQP